MAQVQASLRRRILRAFVGRGLIETVDAKDKLAQRTHWREAKAAIQTCCEAALRARLSASRLAPKGVANQVLRRFKLSGIGDA